MYAPLAVRERVEGAAEGEDREEKRRETARGSKRGRDIGVARAVNGYALDGTEEEQPGAAARGGRLINGAATDHFPCAFTPSTSFRLVPRFLIST